MKKLLKDKKGVAIELAISMLVIVFALCTILVMLAKQLFNGRLTATDNYNTYSQVDIIGEDFTKSSTQIDANGWYIVYTNVISEATSTTDDAFYCEIIDDNDKITGITKAEGKTYKELLVKESENGNVLLKVIYKKLDEGKKQIVLWQYPTR